MTRRAALLWIAASLVLLITTLGISLQLAPTLIYQGRDSGIVAYTSHRVLEGDVLYREVWDNKPPVIYYVNALAFAIIGTNRWALWWVDTLSVYLAALTLFWLIRRVYQWWPLPWLGSLALILWARHPGLVWDTIFTEVIALPFQVLCFALGYEFLRRPQAKTGFLLGLASCAAFLTKQTTVGVALAFVPAVLISRHPVIHSPQRWRWLGIIIAGGLIGLGTVALFFAAQGALDEGFSAAFRHPRLFHEWVSRRTIPLTETVKITLKDSVVPDIFGPAWPFLLGAALIVGRHLIKNTRSAEGTLALWAALTAITDLMVMNLTARAYEHYYVTLIPSITLLMVTTVSVLPQIKFSGGRRTQLVLHGLIYLLLIIEGGYILSTAGWTTYKTARDRLFPKDENGRRDYSVVRDAITGDEVNYSVAGFVRDNTQPGDTVLVWGASTAINFQSERDAPSRFHYGYALIAPNYSTDEQIAQFVADLNRNQPALIVDRTITDGNRIPPLNADERADWLQRRRGRPDTADLTPIYDFYETHCTEIAVRYTNGTIVYRCRY